MLLAPIALFVYNRPAHTRRTLEALQNNELAKRSDLFIYSDAPSSKLQVEKVREVRRYIRSVEGFNSITVIERERNFGLARSIIEGVTEIVNKYGRIIVLEDDLIATPHFLDFMNRALDKYENEKQVMQVSGYMFPVELVNEEDALFLPLTTSWGWATWKRAWKLFDPDAKGYQLVKEDLVLRKRFNLDGAYDYYSMLEAQLDGKVDSWAVRWQLSTFLNNGLVLYPLHSLIANSGFDGSGTHGTMVGSLSKSGVDNEYVPEQLPDEIRISTSWEAVCRMLKYRFTIWDRLKARIHSMFSTRLKGVQN